MRFHPPCCSGRPLPRGAFRSGGARACTARERMARRTLAATDGDAAAISSPLLSIPPRSFRCRLLPVCSFHPCRFHFRRLISGDPDHGESGRTGREGGYRKDDAFRPLPWPVPDRPRRLCLREQPRWLPGLRRHPSGDPQCAHRLLLGWLASIQGRSVRRMSRTSLRGI